jgi:hypothetical protein
MAENLAKIAFFIFFNVFSKQKNEKLCESEKFPQHCVSLMLLQTLFA